MIKEITYRGILVNIETVDGRMKVTDEHTALIKQLLIDLKFNERFAFDTKKAIARIHKEVFKKDNHRWISLKMIIGTHKFSHVQVDTLKGWELQSVCTSFNKLELVFTIDLGND